VPPPEIRQFLTAPWPHYITLEDLFINALAYIPLGFLLALALRTRLRAPLAALGAFVFAVAISMTMETLQTLLPTRIASNVDILTNGLGALIGALAAPLFLPSRRLGARLAAFRNSWFREGRLGDLGLVLIGLWALAQLHPTAQVFGTGDLRATLALPAWFIHTPPLTFTVQAAVVALNLLALAAATATFARGPVAAATTVAVVLVGGLALKMVATAGLVRPAASLHAWLTPGVALGLALGAALVYPLTRLPRRVCAALSLLLMAAALAAINLAPEYPYASTPEQLLARNPSHFLSYSAMASALSEIWPFLMLVYLAVAAIRRDSTRPVR